MQASVNALVPRYIIIDICLYKRQSFSMRHLPLTGFEWDEGNREKCQTHGVTLEEVEAFFRQERVYVTPDLPHSQQEHRLLAAGRCPLNGRPMFVVFTLRGAGDQRRIRPISARYMHQREARKYAQEDRTSLHE